MAEDLPLPPDIAAQQTNATSLTHRPFASSAAVYDLLYAGKDYDSESEFYSMLMAGDADEPYGLSCIEWGCGTGEFLRRFIAMGWQAIGIEPSDSMAEVARKKNLPVVIAEMESLKWQIPEWMTVGIDPAEQIRRVTRPRNTACAPFAVLSYIGVDGDLALRKSLLNVRKKLLPGGRFVFDVLNLAAAASRLRQAENLTAVRDQLRVDRTAAKQFNAANSLVTIAFDYTVREGGQPAREWQEIHRLRAFSPPEIEMALIANGFKVLDVVSISGARPITSFDWEFVVVAERVEEA